MYEILAMPTMRRNVFTFYVEKGFNNVVATGFKTKKAAQQFIDSQA